MLARLGMVGSPLAFADGLCETPSEELCIYENLHSPIVCLLSPVFILINSRCLRLSSLGLLVWTSPNSVAYIRLYKYSTTTHSEYLASTITTHSSTTINAHTSIMFGSRSRKESVSQGRSRKESVSKHRSSTTKHTKQPSFSQSSRKVEKLVQQARPVSQAPSSNATSPSLGR